MPRRQLSVLALSASDGIPSNYFQMAFDDKGLMHSIHQPTPTLRGAVESFRASLLAAQKTGRHPLALIEILPPPYPDEREVLDALAAELFDAGVAVARYSIGAMYHVTIQAHHQRHCEIFFGDRETPRSIADRLSDYERSLPVA